MKTKTKYLAKQTLAMLIIGACFSMLSATEATAGDKQHRSHVVYSHYAYSKPARMPRWLRGDREFKYWYLSNRYALRSNLSWQRRYDIFQYERYYRLKDRRFRGRVMHDSRYRTYRDKPRRRKY